jgi:hypothetical protein
MKKTIKGIMVIIGLTTLVLLWYDLLWHLPPVGNSNKAQVETVK